MNPASTFGLKLSLLAGSMFTTFAAGAATPITSTTSVALAIAGTLLASAPAAAADAAQDRRFGASKPVAPYSPLDADGRARYTVVLTEPSVASYRGNVPGFARIPSVVAGNRRGRPDLASPQARAYRNFLATRQGEFVGRAEARIGRALAVDKRFDLVLNAVVAKLTPTEAAALESDPNVRLVARERLRPLATYATPAFLGATGVWAGTSTPAGSPGTRGEGIVVGVLDTGINYLSNSFKATSDDGYVHVNPRGAGNYLGECGPLGSDVGRCNAKLIGMYNMITGGSGADDDGHGSHTASTAAGGVVNNASFSGITTSLAGIAPRANIIAYRVCDNSGCGDTAIIDALEQAPLDNVDVINYSIGGPSPSPWEDPTDLAFLGLHDAGVFAAAAAGNDGPFASTTNNDSPWVTTVGSTTPGSMPAFDFDLTGPVTVPANTQNISVISGSDPQPAGAVPSAPVIESPNFSNGSNDGCAAFPANTFRVGGTGAGAQAIAVLRLDQNASNCGSVGRRANAAAAGAIAVVFVDPEYINLGASGFSYSMLSSDWDNIKAYNAASASSGATASIGGTRSIGPRAGDRMSGFSSRGPSPFASLKPDISAPGDVIIAAVIPVAAGSYGAVSGTSMASPHIAGAAALVRDVHPDWTPMEVKSALMTTATPAVLNSTGTAAANPNDTGAGRVDLSLATKAGLILDESGTAFDAADPATGGIVESLNVASYYQPDCIGTCTFPRTVEATKASSWSISVGGLPAASFELTTTNFVLAAGATQSFTLTVDATQLVAGEWNYGEVVLTPADPTIPGTRMPLAIRGSTPVLATDVSSISATVAAGSSTTRTVVVSNDGNPTLEWEIATTSLAGAVLDQSSGQVFGLPNGNFGTTPSSTNRNDNFSADDFVLSAGGVQLRKLKVAAFVSDGTPNDLHGTALTWRIYAGAATQPSGRPTIAADTQPVFTFSSAPGATGLTYSGDDVELDFAAAGVTPPTLAAGRYWVSVAPTAPAPQGNSAPATQWYWLTTDDGTNPTAQHVAPSATGNGSAALRVWQPTTTFFAGLAPYDAMSLRVDATVTCGAPWLSVDNSGGSLGLAEAVPIVATLDATSLATGTYTAYLCIDSNGTSPSPPTKLIPVTLTVTGSSTPLVITSATASPALVDAGQLTLLRATVMPGSNPASTGLVVVADLVSIGGAANQALNDTGANGDVTAGDNIFSANATVAVGTPAGAKTLPVTATDAQARTAASSIALVVGDAAPVAVNDAATVDEDAPAAAVDVFANDTDSDGGTRSIASTTQPSNGTVAITGDGAGLTYAPNANYCNSAGAPDIFTYTLNGGSSATVSMTVTCIDDAPVAVNDVAAVDEDSAATTIDVLANDTDVDAGARSVAQVAQPSSGSVAITNAGADVSYTPAANFCSASPVTFTYTLNGGSTGTVSVTVACVNDAPVAADASVAITSGSAAGTAVTTVGATDVDGPALSYAITSGNTGNAFAIDAATGAITVADPAAVSVANAPFSLVVTVSDGGTPAGTDTAIITVNVTDTVDALFKDGFE